MSVLIAGELSAGLQQQVSTMFDMGGLNCRVCPDFDAARDMLTEEDQPSAVLLHIDAPGARDFVRWMRRQSSLFGVPLLVTVDWPSPEEFQRASELGADDVLVDGDRVGILRRARVLSALDPAAATMEPKLGRCLVEHPDPVRRVGLGRVLMQAGFDARFVGSVEELIASARSAPPAMVVLAETMTMPEAIQRVTKVRQATKKPDLPCVVTLSREDVARAATLRERLPAMALLREGASSSDALFNVNQMMVREAQRNERHSRRLLFETLCGFRELDAESQPSFSLSYNASRGGIYVRTYNLPPKGVRLELRLRPPQRAAALALVGRVAWMRPPGKGPGTPVGFGVEFLQPDCAARDWEVWQESIRQAEAAAPEPLHVAEVVELPARPAQPARPAGVSVAP
ncbi:MAG: hypothetical protein JST92_02020 [Deltaproteobacteria bacterium]|nr:hypothetical protein [Deltaproteobacteria bacterium]